MTVFISYRSSRKAEAEQLSEHLESAGIPTFVAHRDIRPGQDWPTTITSAIDNAAAVIVLFCQDSDRSRHVKREIGMADSRRLPCFPVRLESVEPKGLEYFLNTAQWFDWTDRNTADLDLLVTELQKVTGGTPSAVTGSPSPSTEPRSTPIDDSAPAEFPEVLESVARRTGWISDRQMTHMVGELKERAAALSDEFGDDHPAAQPAVNEYLASWFLLRDRFAEALPPVSTNVNFTKPCRIALGRVTPEAKYETFDTRFVTPRAGTKREQKLAALDEQTGTEVAEALFALIDADRRRRIVAALRAGDTASIKTLIGLLLSEDEWATVRDC
ncbi:MAG: toll/interleukin-1 receptor domain-containing protein [Gordonia sp. (in: high G+C Gram-positive bacteria)]|uniref:toll/interleukin-1 receptor domain-containing protein n=1 Tax=Gordonia sp. (in: high G+C Gram-positive bacteria) TaxID=84139 RepID=UPI0039E3CFEE